MKYLRLYEFNDEFKKDYWGEPYNEPWISLTEKESKPVGDPTGFIINGGPYFNIEDDGSDYPLISSGSTSDYDGIYVFDHYDSGAGINVYVSGNKTLYSRYDITSIIPSDTTDINLPQFGHSVMYTAIPDNPNPPYNFTCIKVSELNYEVEISDLDRVNYNKTEREKLMSQPLTLDILENGTFTFHLQRFVPPT